MSDAFKIVQVAPDEPTFRQYAGELERAITPSLPQFKTVYFKPLDRKSDLKKISQEILSHIPDLIHFQHEYGCFGSKLPLLYRFPEWLDEIFKHTTAKVVATAHTVMGDGFKYPIQSRNWQTPLRLVANRIMMARLIHYWNHSSWGELDGVIVHSDLQAQIIQHSSQAVVTVIPHFVPTHTPHPHAHSQWLSGLEPDEKIILVFGYITPEKGQDIVINAMNELGTKARLIIAGGLRRNQDEAYLKHCKKLIDTLGLGSKVKITGFIPFEELDALSARADLVVAPFKWTSGSGSLANLMSRKMPILASDLPLNLELEKRVPGCLSFFKSADASDCAKVMDALLQNKELTTKMRHQAGVYAQKYSVSHIATLHREFYQRLLGEL